ncbi:hypothetical protein [Alteromonas antoniana]|uniref:hypothetical protein n=1 Tax=Alteromonas antoniana TaxID=2803813 RepID=UPI001C43BC74|nr:hypothetical protein [Alteromonas antoniana]
MKNKTLSIVTVISAILFTTAVQANPNTINVEYRAQEGAPGQLILYQDNQPIEIIEFTQDKKFIRFEFPAGYSDFDLKVFEQNELAEKNAILSTYAQSTTQGIAAFNALWAGHASSAQNAREFQVHSVGRKALVVRNKNVDGTPEGVLHDYIVRFTVGNTTYLLDPSIRNTTRR